jgi:gliding motility-associated-like protein
MASPIATTTYAIYSTTDTAYVTVTVDSAYSFSVSQTICQGDSIQLPGGSYVSTAGSYSDLLTSSTGCDSVIITNLLVISPIVNSVSLSICAGDSILLEGVWQTSAGSYDDTTIAANGCDSIIITTLSIDSVFDASIDFVTGLCQNNAPLTLTVTTTGGTWSGTGIDSTTGVFDPSVAGGGTHEIVYIIDSNCGSSDTVDIEVYVLPSLSFTTTDESCEGENDGAIDLTVVGGASPYAYSWDDPVSSTTDTLMALPPGTYTVVVTDSNSCSITDSIEILQSTEPCFAPYLYIPNVFSPNDDGVNDILYVQGQGIAEFNFALYDRWGELMFETSDQTIGWDGMFEGKRLNEAVFFYYVNALTIDDKTIKKKGNITLLR